MTETAHSDVIRSEQAESVEPYSEKNIWEWLSALPDAYVTCRLFNHAWMTNYGYHDVTVNGRAVKEMTCVCDRCQAEKAERIIVVGGRIERDSTPPIFYPDGYLAPHGMGVTKAHVREFVARRAGVKVPRAKRARK